MLKGFLGNDMELAGSLYRCFYDTQLSDPVALGNLVRYVRSEVMTTLPSLFSALRMLPFKAKYLFDLDTGEILACGVPKWKTDENMPDHRTSKKSDYNN